MNTRKIVLMSQLAIYEKKYGKGDFEKSNYYKEDYIYLKNMWTRVFAMLGGIILITIFCLLMLGTVGLDKTINYILDNHKLFAYFIVAIFIFYTVLGRIIYSKEYVRSQKRLESYARLLNKISESDEQHTMSKTNDEKNINISKEER